MSAYRSGISTGKQRTIVCAACGAFAQIFAGDATFRCPTCNREQSSTPEPHVERVTSTGCTIKRAYNELVPFGESVQVNEPCASIDLDVHGMQMQVALDIDSGSVRGLEMSANSKGLPTVTFRREQMADIDAKAAGVTRELQVGDTTFDGTVFIESDAADDDVRMVVESPHVRAAILELLQSYEQVEMSAGTVALQRNFGIPRAFDVGLMHRQIALLRLVAGAARPPTLGAERGSPATLWFLMLGLNVPGAWTAFCVFAGKYEPIDSAPVFVALIAGLVVAAALQPLLHRLLRGRSTSHREIPVARAAAFLSMPPLVAALFLLANAKLDDSPSKLQTLKIESVDFDSDDHESKAKTNHGSYRFHDSKQQVRAGLTLRVKTRAGALGVEWQSSPAVVDIDGTTFEED